MQFGMLTIANPTGDLWRRQINPAATIAGIAMATNCRQIKTGSLNRPDRLAKYRQLPRLEQLPGPNAVYAGTNALAKARR